MADVPEGQVPRNEAFWRTYHAVNAEMEERLVKYRCSRDGHSLLLTADWSGCENCRMPMDEVMREYGAARSADGWVLECPPAGGISR